MGKYMKKGKITAVMEIPQSNNSSTLGVRTRARTLALQPNPDSSSYLQLRSRRLQKPPFPSSNNNTLSQSNQRSSSKVPVKSDNSGGASDSKACFSNCLDLPTLEPSFGDNNFEFDSRERSTRESTPCSLIRDPETIATPGSSTRPSASSGANRRARNTQRTTPTNPEMEEFFAGFEDDQQKLFIEKYNYDIKNDVPLPGRYEWVKVD